MNEMQSGPGAGLTGTGYGRSDGTRALHTPTGEPPVSVSTAVERIARVLAAWTVSSNAEGEDASGSAEVDQDWPDRVEEAIAVLKALREPDPAMAAAGDAATWQRMVEAAIGGRGALDLPDVSSAPMPHVRSAGMGEQTHDGPWTRQDERVDESFPASDPMPSNPGVA